MNTPDDLIILVADTDMKITCHGLLARYQSLGIRETTSNILTHPECDPGCFLRCHEFLRAFAAGYSHALVVFDREGCGQEGRTRIELEADAEQRLAQCGWGDRAAAIAIDPELEAWVWTDSPHVDEVLGWKDASPGLRQRLLDKGILAADTPKPSRPKEAMEFALQAAKRPRSSALYGRLASRVSLERCADPAFLKFRETLTKWFGTSQ